MGHVLEPAASGRAACRGCKVKIRKGELRFGQREPNPYGDGEATWWYHLRCAAQRVGEPFAETLEAHEGEVEDRTALQAVARETAEHPRLARLGGLERSPSGRARCRHCREPIPKDALRVALSVIEEGMVQPIGFVHAECARAYFGTAACVPRLEARAAELGPEDRAALAEILDASGEDGPETPD